MAFFFRWMVLLACLLASACGGSGSDHGDGDADEQARGDGDGDDDGDGQGDADEDDFFTFAADSGVGREGASPDAGPTDGEGASSADEPEAIVGDGWLRFNDVMARDDGGLRLTIAVPAGADSMIVTLDAGATVGSLALVELTDPNGDLIYDLRDEETVFPYQPTLPRNVNDHLPFSFMLPTSPEHQLRSGDYGALLFVEDPTEAVNVDVVFLSLPPGSVDAEPRVSVNLWFASGASMDAAAANGDADFADAVDTMIGIFRDIGIRVDRVDYGDITGDDSLATVEGDAELAELIGELRGHEAQALHFIFVEHMENERGNTILGRSSGVPGPPAHPDLARRGAVVIALDSLSSSALRTGELFAHEAAHYQGLGHTSEAMGGPYDPLEDTAECPADLATRMTSGGDLILSPEDCAEHDGYNLMFYARPAGSMEQRALTSDQAVILAVNPLVRWVAL